MGRCLKPTLSEIAYNPYRVRVMDIRGMTQTRAPYLEPISAILVSDTVVKFEYLMAILATSPSNSSCAKVLHQTVTIP